MQLPDAERVIFAKGKGKSIKTIPALEIAAFPEGFRVDAALPVTGRAQTGVPPREEDVRGRGCSGRG